MKRIVPFLIVAVLCLGVGLYVGIALGTRLGIRKSLTRMTSQFLEMHADLTASPNTSKAFRDGFLLDVQGFQSQLDKSFVSYLHSGDLVFAFKTNDDERQQRQAAQAYLAKYGLEPSL